MHNITKHDSEKEWECYTSKDGWIYFLIGWNAISVNNLLRNVSEIIQDEESWSPESNIIITFFNSETNLSITLDSVDIIFKVLNSWNPAE